MDDSHPDTPAAATAIARELLVREGRLLDRRDWAGWLALYEPHAVFWVPAWRDEEHETRDPDRELSQIYHPSRRGLEERVMRVQSGKSVTTRPPLRTVHFVSNVAGRFTDTATVEAEASWQVQVYDPRRESTHTHFGHYELRAVRTAQDWRIAAKTIHLVNDLVPALIDFYTL